MDDKWQQPIFGEKQSSDPQTLAWSMMVGWQSQRSQGWTGQMQHTQMATDWPKRVNQQSWMWKIHSSLVSHHWVYRSYLHMHVYVCVYIYIHIWLHKGNIGILIMATNKSLSGNVAKIHQEHWTKLASADKARRCFRTSQCPTILKLPLNLARRFSPYPRNTAWIKVLCCAHDSESRWSITCVPVGHLSAESLYWHDMSKMFSHHRLPVQNCFLTQVEMARNRVGELSCYAFCTTSKIL